MSAPSTGNPMTAEKNEGAVSDWRTISSAPKDGTEFEARCGLFPPTTAHYNGSVFVHHDDDDGEIAYPFTHWKPRAEEWHCDQCGAAADERHNCCKAFAETLVTAAGDRGDGDEPKANEPKAVVREWLDMAKRQPINACHVLRHPPISPGDLDAIESILALVSRLEETIRADGAARGQQIAWRPGVPPTDAGVIYGHSWSPFRWHPYSPKSDQYRSGLTGRWQAMGEYGGWTNAKPPNEWATQAEIEARARLSARQEGGGE